MYIRFSTIKEKLNFLLFNMYLKEEKKKRFKLKFSIKKQLVSRHPMIFVGRSSEILFSSTKYQKKFPFVEDVIHFRERYFHILKCALSWDPVRNLVRK